jgi:hypothetical protein
MSRTIIFINTRLFHFSTPFCLLEVSLVMGCNISSNPKSKFILSSHSAPKTIFYLRVQSSTVIMNIFFITNVYHIISYHDPHMRCKGLCNNVAYNHLTLLNSWIVENLQIRKMTIQKTTRPHLWTVEHIYVKDNNIHQY